MAAPSESRLEPMFEADVLEWWFGLRPGAERTTPSMFLLMSADSIRLLSSSGGFG
jgi:hypothetical protein